MLPLAAVTLDDVSAAMRAEVSPTEGMAAALGLDGAPAVVGRVRAIYGPTACRPAGGVNPYVWAWPSWPVAGQVTTVRGTSRATLIPDAPSTMMWWVIGYHRAASPIDWSPYGLPGCRLLIGDPMLVLIHDQPELEMTRGWAVWRRGGQAWMRWRPPSWFVRHQLYVQLLVAAPGENRGGFLVSQGVELDVGSEAWSPTTPR